MTTKKGGFRWRYDDNGYEQRLRECFDFFLNTQPRAYYKLRLESTFAVVVKHQ